MSDIQPRPYSKDYEITDAMFGAFRSPGGAKYFWKLFGWSTLLFSVVYLLGLPSFIRGYANLIGSVITVDQADIEADPNAAAEAVSGMMGSFASLIPGLLIISIGALAVVSVVRAAFYRRYFFNETDGFFPFRLGGDEGRQFLAQLGYWGLFIVAMFIGAIVMAIIIGIVAGIAGATGSTAGMVVAGLFGVVAYLGFYAFLFWFGVKFAPAGALTGLRRKVHVLAARKISANRFWALFGSILVAGIIGYVTYYAMFIIGGIIGFGSLFSGDALESAAGNDPEAFLASLLSASQTTGFRIGAAIGIILMSAGQAFYTVILLGPSAFFVKQWDEADPTAVFE